MAHGAWSNFKHGMVKRTCILGADPDEAIFKVLTCFSLGTTSSFRVALRMATSIPFDSSPLNLAPAISHCKAMSFEKTSLKKTDNCILPCRSSSP